MGTVIKVKYSTITAQPTSEHLTQAELGYSYASGRLFIGGTTGNEPVAVGGTFYTDLLSATAGTTTASKALIVDNNKWLTELYAGSIKLASTSGGSGQLISSINTSTSLTGAANTDLATSLAVKTYVDTQITTAISLDTLTDVVISGVSASQLLVFNNGTGKWENKSLGGDATINTSGTLTLATLLDGTTNKVPGAYGSATSIPTFTVDAKGRITLVSNLSISIPHTQINDWDEAVQDVIGSKVTGGTGVTVSYDDVVTGNTTVSIGQPVGTSDSVTFNNATLTGYLRGPSTFTIDPASHGDNTGTVVIAGNLQVDGTTTTINSTTITIDDKNVVLGDNAATPSELNGAGITIGPGISGWANATFTYDYSNDRWTSSKDIAATNFIGLASSATTLAGGNAGTLVYQSATGTTAYLAAGTNGYILYSNAGTPAWTNTIDGGTF